MLAGKEVVVPCMVDGNKDDLHLRRAKIQRLRGQPQARTTTRSATSSAGAARTSAGSRACPASPTIPPWPRVDPDAQAISCLDFDGDGKPDLCLAGAGRVVAAAERRRIAQRDQPARPDRRLPGRRLGRLQRRRQARPAPGHADGPEAVHQPRQRHLPRRQPSAAARAGLQPDRRRLDRPRRRRPARHPARQRLPRPAPLPQQGAGRHRPPPLKLGKWHYSRPVRQRRTARASPPSIRRRRAST